MMYIILNGLIRIFNIKKKLSNIQCLCFQYLQPYPRNTNITNSAISWTQCASNLKIRISKPNIEPNLSTPRLNWSTKNCKVKIKRTFKMVRILLRFLGAENLLKINARLQEVRKNFKKLFEKLVQLEWFRTKKFYSWKRNSCSNRKTWRRLWKKASSGEKNKWIALRKKWNKQSKNLKWRPIFFTKGN